MNIYKWTDANEPPNDDIECFLKIDVRIQEYDEKSMGGKYADWKRNVSAKGYFDNDEGHWILSVGQFEEMCGDCPTCLLYVFWKDEIGSTNMGWDNKTSFRKICRFKANRKQKIEISEVVVKQYFPMPKEYFEDERFKE